MYYSIFLCVQQGVISLLVALFSLTVAQGPISLSEVFLNQDGVDANYNINHRPEFGGPQSAVFFNRNPLPFPLVNGVNPFLGIPPNVNATVANIPSLYQNPFGYGAVRPPFFGGLLPFGNRNMDYFNSGMTPYSPVFGNSPFISRNPYFDAPYYGNLYGGFNHALDFPYPVNPAVPFSYQGFNPFGYAYNQQFP